MAPTRRLYATRLGRVLLVLGISLLFFSRDFFFGVCACSDKSTTANRDFAYHHGRGILGAVEGSNLAFKDFDDGK